MKIPSWLNIHHVIAFHEKQLREHGGLHGIQDKNLLESALTRPQHLFHYEKPSLFELSAAYAVGIIKNHPFVDGNKRTGIVTAGVFLDINEFELVVPEIELYQQVMALAENNLAENGFSDWLQVNCKKTLRT